MFCILQDLEIFGSECPRPTQIVFIPVELDGKEPRLLLGYILIPMANEQLIIDQGTISSILPFLVVLFDGTQVVVWIHVGRKDQNVLQVILLFRACVDLLASSELEVRGAGSSGEAAHEIRRPRDPNEGRKTGGQGRRVVIQRDRVDVLVDHMGQSSRVEPECVASVNEGELDGADCRVKRRDVDGLVRSGGYIDGGTLCVNTANCNPAFLKTPTFSSQTSTGRPEL